MTLMNLQDRNYPTLRDDWFKLFDSSLPVRKYHYLSDNADLDLKMELAGVSKANCQVEYEDGYITITATNHEDKKIEERVYVGKQDPSTLKADLKDGLLHLTGKVKTEKVNIQVK